MPEKRTLERARRKARQGKSASTAAGEFVREEIEDIRKGKHGARSTKQAIAIGLSKARRAGVPLAAHRWAVSAFRARRPTERTRSHHEPGGGEATRAVAEARNRRRRARDSRPLPAPDLVGGAAQADDYDPAQQPLAQAPRLGKPHAREKRQVLRAR